MLMITSTNQLLRRQMHGIQATLARLIHKTMCFRHGTNLETERSKLRSFDEIPTKTSFLPAFIELLLAGGPGYLHTYCHKRHTELGPIYRDYLGKTEIVFLCDTNHIQTVIANEGQYPRHNVPEAWSYYNATHNIQRGLFFQMGEPWLRARRVFNQVMAKPGSTSRFASELFVINDDLLNSWLVKFEKSEVSEAKCVVPDIKAALCNWSIESTGLMLFGSRMGCVPVGSNAPDPRADELVGHVTRMFDETSNFQLIPVGLAHKLNLGSWRRFEGATSGMLRLANLYAKENMEKLKNGPKPVSILADMMEMDALTEEEISRSLVDLIIAAADTTSAALQWMVYLLAKHQNLQARILAEVNIALSENLTVEKFKESVPLLRAFVRESLRLYPTAPFLARTLDRDIILDRYKIPAGKLLVFSLYTTSRMEKYFEEPLEFKPERWLRSSMQANREDLGRSGGCPYRNKHAYASLPFGAGSRICVGRRAAELQMMIFLASLVRKFQSSLSGKDETKVRLKMILAPTRPISIKLRLRQ